MRRTRRGFTLIELLVVIAIIALLVSILAPMMRNIQELLRQVICMNGLHQINTAIDMYRKDNQYRMHPTGHAPGWGFWEHPPGTRLSSFDTQAYWGVAYLPYLGNVRDVFRCPSSMGMDCEWAYDDWLQQQTTTYGMNMYIEGSQYFAIQKPNTTIICHDAFEHRLEVREWAAPWKATDALTAWAADPPTGINLMQWRYPCTRSYCFYYGTDGGHVKEFYRHLNKCDVLWYDGHVGSINESDGTDVPRDWYTGG